MKVDLTIKDDWSTKTIPAIVGRNLLKVKGWEFVWWGFSQIHKWRWHRSHIDLGALSVYGFQYNHWFWWIIAFIIKPLRCNYHRQFKGDWLARYEEQSGGNDVGDKE